MSARGEDSKRLTVPKFSSFKPKEPLPKEESKDEQHRSRDRDSKRDSHRRDGHRRSESRRHAPLQLEERPRRRPRLEKDDNPGNAANAANAAKASATPVGVPGVFAIDTKGDRLITKYGGIDKSQIPAYYRSGGGRVLGTVGRLVIHRDGPRDRFSLRMPGEGSWAKDRGGLRSETLRLKTHSVRVRAVPQLAGDDDNDGFLSVESSRKRKRGQQDPESSEDEQPSYRSIEGKAKPKNYSDEEDDSDTSARMIDADQDDPLKWKSIQLGRQVKDHPEDIDTWLELVDHQDALLQANHGVNEKATENEAHSFTEIKVSMLESALANATQPQDRQRVLTRLMQEGVKVWSGNVAAKKWSEVSREEEGNFELWKTHLDFATSNIGTFDYGQVKLMLAKRLQSITSRKESEPLENAFCEALYVFLRATRLMHDAGYKELAAAAWQALLDLNFLRPATVESDAWALSSFNEFWESEVPRMGETNAQGWGHYIQTGGSGDPPEPATDEAVEPTSSRDSYRAWGNIERIHAQRADVPARTLDAGNEDDPFRVVMFSDLEPFLFLIPAAVLPIVAHVFIDMFLLFSGYPPAFMSSHWTEMAYNDQFLVSPREALDTSSRGPSQEPNDGDMQRKAPEFHWEILRASLSPDLLFNRTGWFGFFMGINPAEEKRREFVANVTKQLTFEARQEDLALYYLALTFACDPDNIRKAAKRLLKQYATNLDLYNGYALAEICNGQVDVGTKVLGSAMELPQASPSNKLVLWNTWSWMELQQGNVKTAAHRLCSSVDEGLQKAVGDGRPAAGSILKARETFASYLYESLSTGKVADSAVPAESLILLAYFTTEGPSEPMSASQGNISAAVAVTDTMIDEFKIRKHHQSAALERVLQVTARLLYLNATRGPFRRAYMQSHLSRFIDMFPKNTIFMALFQWADSSLRVVDETRSLIAAKALNPAQDSVGNRAFAIRHELLRGNDNTTTAAFEHAVTSDACKASAWLWIAYVRFCQSRDGLRAKAKSVFYRALGHVPFSKDAMMEAFGTLVRGMESDELRSVFNTMTSKDLRVHVDLDEFLQKRRAGQRGGGTRA